MAKKLQLLGNLFAKLHPVATSGSYNDLSNKPTQFSGSYKDLTNTPALAKVATSGDYNDLANMPVGSVVSETEYHSYTLSNKMKINGQWFWYSNNNLSVTSTIDLTQKISFKFCKSPSYAYKVFFTTEYVYATKIQYNTNGNIYYAIFGNASLYNSSFPATDDNWCVYVDPVQFKAYSAAGDIYKIDCSNRIDNTIMLDEKYIPNTIARTSDIAPEIETALTEAKESGEFDGPQGPQGEPGVTPVKGTDYWTESDKTDIINAVLDALPVAEEASV